MGALQFDTLTYSKYIWLCPNGKRLGPIMEIDRRILEGGCPYAEKLVDVRNWVLQFANDAEVLQPESLMEDLANEIQNLSARYGTD